MDRGAWGATVHGLTKSQTRLSDLAHTHAVGHLVLPCVPLPSLESPVAFAPSSCPPPSLGWWSLGGSPAFPAPLQQ